MALDRGHIVRCCREQPICQTSQRTCYGHFVSNLRHVGFASPVASCPMTAEQFLGRTVKDRMGRSALITFVEVEIDVPALDM